MTFYFQRGLSAQPLRQDAPSLHLGARHRTGQVRRTGKKLGPLLVACLSLCSVPAASADAPVNDHIFPAAPAARSGIDFDAHGFLINGHRTFLVSAGMEYARVPRELWQDRLLRLKRGGFNTVEIYTFWNYHEPQEGRFEFTGDHDLDAFLKLVRQMGMYAIVRVGPYYCAEWDQGGYPNWLRFKPGVRVREPNALFQQYVDRYFDKLIPIVAANQVHRGGAVILVQLENEHPAGWGTTIPNAYFAHLRDKALSLGIEVPYFFSGLHHASDPAGNAASLDDPTRPNPWFSTEFWSVWYDQYGAKPTDATVFGRRAWEIIAHGGSGYNIYMAHGGSNFGYTNDNEDAASYDYGAAVGQGGDLRPVYYSFKRAAWFARSFETILADSVNASSLTVRASNPAVLVTERHSAAGNILFLDNPTATPQQTGLSFAGKSWLPRESYLLAPGEILPIVSEAQVTEQVTLVEATHILALSRPPASKGRQAATTLILHGAPGSATVVTLRTKSPPEALSPATAFTQAGDRLALRVRFGASDPSMYAFVAGNDRFRVLAIPEAAADRTWLADMAGSTCILVGPGYVSETAAVAQTGTKGSRLHFMAESGWIDQSLRSNVANSASTAKSALPRATGYCAADTPVHFVADPPAPSRTLQHATALPLAPWETSPAAQAAATAFDDRSWTASQDPQQMGADGSAAPEAWYRTLLQVRRPGQQMLHFEQGGDRATLYIDGQQAGKSVSHTPRFLLALSPGTHSLSLYTAQDGRDKLWNVLGPLEKKDPKGVTGAAMLWEDVSIQPLQWKKHMTYAAGAPSMPPFEDDPGWTTYTPDAGPGEEKISPPPAPATPSTNVGAAEKVQPGAASAWFQALLLPTHSAHHALEFPGSNQEFTVYLDGRLVLHHEQWGEPFSINLEDAFRTRQPLELTLLIRNQQGKPFIDPTVRLVNFQTASSVQGWRMQGIDASIRGVRAWSPLQPSSLVSGPRLFRSRFAGPLPTGDSGETVWRVEPVGLGHGTIFVNGHNLGRYPDKVASPGLYLPSCWLKPDNTVIIYDEEGNSPARVSIQAEPLASRATLHYVQQQR